MKSLVLLLVFLATACDQTTAPVVATADTACNPGEAQIRVSDGYFENLCGCVEPTGTITSSGTFTCTVKTGAWVFFLYIDTHINHQIISTGGLSFVSGGVNQPGSSNNSNLAAQFTSAGTADFEDAFNTTIQGKIVVTP
jgi:hypothetical protein